ncbi:DUF1796 family putative cysteine peptidase [Muricoccus pecuniae]|uniref:Papain-like cysteine peptidase n=1 Tax=Muricoccus pecuniae TaxID=693023 RepID=A0A840XWA9_9PROT|nr:DUF1796 family putative cysteine peptidase [Roseomonas pecuniae]MBB5693048.1 hypothetical protein [Roseomonas pecuniae]
MPFDYYFSLGVNCQAAFQIRRVLGKDSASFFSWNVTKLGSLVSLLESDFSGILEKENLSPQPGTGLIYDNSHQYSLHSPFKEGDVWEGESYEENYAAFRQKMEYLVSKFRKIARSGQKVAYFYVTQENDRVVDQSKRVRDLLLKAHQGRSFELVVIQDKSRREASWNEPNIRNRYLDRLAPWSDATDGHVKSWDRIFAEFAHADPMRLANFEVTAGSKVNLSNPTDNLD